MRPLVREDALRPPVREDALRHATPEYVFSVAALLLTSTCAAAAVYPALLYAPQKNALLDLTTPDQGAPFTTVLAVHGGGWSHGARTDAAAFCRIIVDAGFACAAMDYRLTPASGFPAQVEDILAATAFLRSHASTYRLDPDRLVLAGESAGGHLVSFIGANSRTLPILGVIVFSAPLDLIALSEPGRALGLVPPEVRALTGATGWTPADLDRLRAASPAFNLRPAAPPFLLIHGQSDELVPPAQPESFCQAVRREGSPCEILMIPQARHGLWAEDRIEKWAPLWRTRLVSWITTLTPKR